MDRILTADRYHHEAALMLLSHWDAQIGWAFQEYADVFRAAWTLNHSLPKGVPRFRIVATGLRPDWSLAKPGDNIVSRPIRRRAWWGSNQVARNVWIAGVVQRGFIDKGLKALVFNSAGHVGLVVTRDAREEVGVRLSAAYQIRRRIGDRVSSIQMDTSMTQNAATSGIIALLPPKYQLIGIDLKGTPVGEVPLE